MRSRLFVICTVAMLAIETAFLAGCASQDSGEGDEGEVVQTPAHPEQGLIDDLVIANRVLASDELGVLGVYGHVSARSGRDPNRYFISRNVAPAFVTAADVIENDLDGKAVEGDRSDQYEERFIDGGIYQ
jgi:hypothetical protein